MSNIRTAFQNGKAFIPFITCGDPDLDTTIKVVKAAAENGADLIELGIPFSDPTAEGPVIQGANIRALAAGTTTDKIFDMVSQLRKEISTPLVFMTYANVVFSYDPERFMARCCENNVGGVILPDLPFEEREEFSAVAAQYGVDLIPLIAPTSADRIAMIAKEASGFIYIVSSLGVTGVRSEIRTDIGQIVDVHLMPEEAYGPSDPEAIITIEIAQLPGSENLNVGERVYLRNMMGQPFPVTVTAKDDVHITLDANHEMAGKELNFRIELLEVTD